MNLAWFGNAVFEIVVSWQPVPLPQGALVDPVPPNKFPSPTIEL